MTDCQCQKCRLEAKSAMAQNYATMELRVVAMLFESEVVSLPIDWSALACQDASPMSRETFIPCSAPASAIVWHQKDRCAYTMCASCADHNVRNRGGLLLAWRKS